MIKPDFSQFKQCADAGYTIIPLRGKQPIDDGWMKRRYDNAETLRRIRAHGYNAGFRVPKNVYVLDPDVLDKKGNRGVVSFDNLCFDLGIDFQEYHRVRTGSGGLHVYGTIPEGLRTITNLGKRGFPGIQVRRFGNQLVLPGSVHPKTGKRYRFQPDSPDWTSPLVAWPEEFLTLITADEAPERANVDGDVYTPGQIGERLAVLDPTKFRDYDEWLRLGMAVRHACADAFEVFQDWSAGDPEYADCADENRVKWDSFASEGISFKTLDWHVAQVRPGILARDDFKDADPIDTDDKPEPMKWDMNKLPAMLDYSESAMLAAKVALYKVEARLVHAIRLEKDDNANESIRRKAGALTLWDVLPLRLREFMIEHAPFYRLIPSPKKPGKFTRIDHPAPLQFANHYLARPDKWKLNPLVGVIETPTLRKDGSLLVTPGYDKASGLLLDSDGFEYPPINDQPTQDEALAALEILKWPFADFPFVATKSNKTGKSESPSRSVMLSAVLTALVRRTLHSAPCHGTSAPTMGTGKTLAQNVVSLIATGRLATAMSQGVNAEEDEKRLFSVLLRNDLIVLIDNVRRPIQFDALCTVLTEPTWQSRFLGESRNITVRTNALVLATGNNLTFAGDMTTRALLARMDARVERPEERSFDVDLKTEIPKRRGELVAAGLTILRAFVVAGRPGLNTFKPFGRFEDWSNLVRGALIWLGEPDPCRTRSFITIDDPERSTAFELFQAMHLVGERDTKPTWRSAGEWIELAEKRLTDDNNGLENAIDAVAHGSAQKLGAYLKSQDGKIVGGLRMWGRRDTHRERLLYRVKPI